MGHISPIWVPWVNLVPFESHLSWVWPGTLPKRKVGYFPRVLSSPPLFAAYYAQLERRRGREKRSVHSCFFSSPKLRNICTGWRKKHWQRLRALSVEVPAKQAILWEFAPLLLHRPVVHCGNLGGVRGCENAFLKCPSSLWRNIRNTLPFSGRHIRCGWETYSEWKPRELVVAVTVVITTVTVKSRYFDNGYCDKANTIAYCHNGLLWHFCPSPTLLSQ